jgi:hypothetical protein
VCLRLFPFDGEDAKFNDTGDRDFTGLLLAVVVAADVELVANGVGSVLISFVPVCVAVLSVTFGAVSTG